MNKLVLKGLAEVQGMKFNHIEGGFGEGKKAMLVKDIAEIHGRDLKLINQNINRNRKRFKNGVDIIDLKTSNFEQPVLAKVFTPAQIGNANNIYLLSERGYSKLLKILEDDFAWEQYEKLVDGYFNMRQAIKQPNSNSLQHQEIKIKSTNAEARLRNARLREAKFLLEQADKRKATLSPQAYELLQINGFELVVGKNALPRPKLETTLYDLTAIATKLGVYSNSGLPHAQAVGTIIAELDLVEDERVITAFDRNGHQGSTYQYTVSVLDKVKNWLDDNGYPTAITAVGDKRKAKNYKVTYKN